MRMKLQLMAGLLLGCVSCASEELDLSEVHSPVMLSPVTRPGAGPSKIRGERFKTFVENHNNEYSYGYHNSIYATNDANDAIQRREKGSYINLSDIRLLLSNSNSSYNASIHVEGKISTAPQEGL